MRRSVIYFVWARHSVGILAAAVALTFALGSPALAKQKKNKKNHDSDNSSQANPVPMPALPVSDQINLDIGHMLGAFQLGDVEVMHKYYSDDATFVSGEWEPPVVGWANYVPLYKREWSAYQGVQLLRKNTYVFTHGDVAWASYQWEFDASYQGQPFQARGQTTLIFNKVGDNWLIVHNHTSEISQACPASPTRQIQPAHPPTSSEPARP
ncbi:MAG TPA: nuclear transport factor 2 family protein [Candidatus Dormibacteraeota bacterium]|nr:nuclear transport factor 2 family protein [Candidatus Dormibacteraeota bacterium]